MPATIEEIVIDAVKVAIRDGQQDKVTLTLYPSPKRDFHR